jgi:hypothetical protein
LERLASALPYPALVAIPEISTPEDDRRGKRRSGLMLGAAVTAFCVCVLLFHFFVTDLGRIWAMMSRGLPR